MSSDVRQSAEWKALVRWAKATLPWLCHLCGNPIRLDVDHRHPMSYALDHKVTVSVRPDLALSPDNVAPSHRLCNSARRDRPLTPGLLLEMAERFTERPPVALDFFSTRGEGG